MTRSTGTAAPTQGYEIKPAQNRSAKNGFRTSFPYGLCECIAIEHLTLSTANDATPKQLHLKLKT